MRETGSLSSVEKGGVPGPGLLEPRPSPALHVAMHVSGLTRRVRTEVAPFPVKEIRWRMGGGGVQSLPGGTLQFKLMLMAPAMSKKMIDLIRDEAKATS